jgi:squalene-hopene/tetraprenyl-beta-curcumene cyclase
MIEEKILGEIEDTIGRAVDALKRRQRDDGHWIFELEADATIPAEYVLLRQYLGEPDAPELEKKIGVYLRRIQGAHGGWPLFHDGAFDISASVKAYFCLKMIGDNPEAPHMARARAAFASRNFLPRPPRRHPRLLHIASAAGRCSSTGSMAC